MAYQMSYTDARLTTHPESVWLPMFVGFDHGSKSGRIVFNGYHDLAALAANAPVIDQKAYEVSGDVYLSIVGGAPSSGSSVLDVVSQACYDYSSTVLDKAAPTEEDPDRKVSFFAGASTLAL